MAEEAYERVVDYAAFHVGWVDVYLRHLPFMLVGDKPIPVTLVGVPPPESCLEEPRLLQRKLNRERAILPHFHLMSCTFSSDVSPHFNKNAIAFFQKALAHVAGEQHALSLDLLHHLFFFGMRAQESLFNLSHRLHPLMHMLHA